MRKSDRTRAAILEAAGFLFAELGYEGATVRAIAERASIDPAMVIRYFESKEALFSRVSAVNLELPDVRDLPPSQAAERLTRHFLELWEGRKRDMGLVILLRAAVANEEAAARIRDIFRRQVIPALVGAGDPASAERRAGLIASQLFGLALCRLVLKMPGISEMTWDELVAHIAPVVEFHMTEEMPGRRV